MDQNSKLNCPQCLHQNSKGTTHCDLCDWPLDQNDEDQTVAPQSISSQNTPSHEKRPKSEADETVAPMNYVSTSNGKQSDPNQTVAPDVLSAQKKTLQQKNTFHLAGDLAHFEIHEILGQGGMGAVYHAKDKTLHRDVAIKMLRPVLASNQLSAEALLDEARMASKLNHPNIVTIYDVARAADSNYIVMEWVDGQPLDELIPEQGLDLVTAMSYACQIADGLNSAHQKYIIHRDIKPQNIMLSADGTLKILDFGIAGLIKHQSTHTSSEADGVSDINQTGKTTAKTIAVGTPSYMSPEQARGLNLDQRSDIFSFGTLLYQMLTGQRPFQGKDIPSIQQAVCEGQYQPIKQLLPALPDALVTLLDKMLATQKDQRWQSSAELAEELHRIYAELTYKKNWWQKRHWLTKAAILIPFIVGLGWSVKDVLFPASTQQLIERQLAEANKIAILPFENISGDPLIQLFGDGLAVNLGTDLATIAAEQNNTWIVPSTEISRMKDQSLKAVADKYGVNLVLTGSIQHMGSTRLLVLNLLDAQTGQQLNTTELNINAGDLFGGHALIREQAMALLDWPISEDLVSKFNAERPELDGAYKLYVEGRGYLYRYDQSNNLDRAIKSFKDAILLDPDYENAYIGVSEVLLNQYRSSRNPERLDDMENYVSKLESLNPQNSQLNFIKAEIKSQRGDYDKSIKLYQSHISNFAKHTMSYIGLSNAYKSTGQNDLAEDSLKKVMKIAPNNWRVLSEMGIFYFENGDHKSAESNFKKLTELSPNNHYSYRLLAAAQYSLNNMNGAILNTTKSIALYPTDEAYTNLGTMYFSTGEYQEAVKAYQVALEIRNSEYINWGNLADAYKMINDSKTIEAFVEAAKRARKELSVNPNQPYVKADLSYYLANMGEQQEAIRFANEIDDSHTGIEHFVVAQTFDHLKMLDKVDSHLNTALRLNVTAEEIKNTPLLPNYKKDDRYLALISELEHQSRK